MDRNRFRFEATEEFLPLAILAMSSLAVSLKQYYEYPEQLVQIREMFRKSLDILKYGSYKKDYKEEDQKVRGDRNE